ncbi:MAG: aminotransferase class I/II-fold pyridoxal phosphate-dependent enzyme [Clostridiaceae bacterium]|jgi:LL-diaminopimelate aminotransferase|nr:aminotransferase class I/II-fold pyridoxal phosphate-dependent enzyme [Clostridiaceae bacterium]
MEFLKDNLFNEQVMNLDTYIMFKLKEQTAKLTPELTKKNRAPISLAMGAPTAKPPKKVIEDLKNALEIDGIHTYSSPKGEQYFREAIAKRMKSRFGVELNPNTEIFSLIGSKEGIANIIRAITTPQKNDKDKDIILTPDPCYASYWQFINTCGALGYHVPLTKDNNYMPDMEQVMKKFVQEGYNPEKIKALIINYPSNPLGATATKEYVKSVVDFCKKHKILLISDAAYSDLYFDEKEKPFSVFEIGGAKDIAVEFFSFSKPYALTGWRLGWVCGNSEVVQRFGKLKSTLDNGIFKALQVACSNIINSEEGDNYIKQANEGFKRKQEIMVNGFKELGWDIDNDKVPHATFYLWLPIPKRYDSAFKFCEDVLKTSGVVIVPGNAFGEYGEGYFRLSYVCSDDQLKEVIQRLKEDNFYFNK